jgi:ribonuclease P protein component
MEPEKLRHKFPKHLRLSNSEDYRGVFELNDVKVAHPCYLLLAKLNKKEYSRLGLIVAKKNLPKSVARNRLKRLVRETFRQFPINPSVDVVFLSRRGVIDIGKQDMHSMLTKAWKRLSLKCQNLENSLE